MCFHVFQVILRWLYFVVNLVPKCLVYLCVVGGFEDKCKMVNSMEGVMLLELVWKWGCRVGRCRLHVYWIGCIVDIYTIIIEQYVQLMWSEKDTRSHTQHCGYELNTHTQLTYCIWVCILVLTHIQCIVTSVMQWYEHSLKTHQSSAHQHNIPHQT